MKHAGKPAELRAVAKHIIWFEEPAKALQEPVRFLAYAMTYATSKEMAVVRRHFSDNDLKAALLNAPPGIFDPRSWAYWNIIFGRYPVPPMPARQIPTKARTRRSIKRR